MKIEFKRKLVGLLSCVFLTACVEHTASVSVLPEQTLIDKTEKVKSYKPTQKSVFDTGNVEKGLFEITRRSSKEVLAIISQNNGLTDAERNLISNIEIRVTPSNRLYAKSYHAEGENIIELSTGYSELFIRLSELISIYQNNPEKECVRSFDLLVSNFYKQNGVLRERLQNGIIPDVCKLPAMTKDDFIIGLSGFVAIPLSHEVAHHLRGDVFQSRNSSPAEHLLIEAFADQMSVNLLSETNLVLYGLPLFHFIENKRLVRGKDHQYIPSLCRAALLFEQYSEYFPGLLESPEQYLLENEKRFRKAPVMVSIFKKIERNRSIGGGLKCPTQNIVERIKNWKDS